MKNQNAVAVTTSGKTAYYWLADLTDNTKEVAYQAWREMVGIPEGKKGFIDDEGYFVDGSFLGFKKDCSKQNLIFSASGKNIYWLGERKNLVDTESHNYE